MNPTEQRGTTMAAPAGFPVFDADNHLYENMFDLVGVPATVA